MFYIIGTEDIRVFSK